MKTQTTTETPAATQRFNAAWWIVIIALSTVCLVRALCCLHH